MVATSPLVAVAVAKPFLQPLPTRPFPPPAFSSAGCAPPKLLCSLAASRRGAAFGVSVVSQRREPSKVVARADRVIVRLEEEELPEATEVRRPWHFSNAAGIRYMSSVIVASTTQLLPSKALAQLCDATITQAAFIAGGSNTTPPQFQRLVLMDMDPASAKLAIGIIGPLLSAYGFLFLVRIVMSWYPKLPVGKFPYVVAYAPTEPLLILTRKLIPPLGGVDVTPVVWFGLISFLNEILVGPQGLLVLLSQQV